MLFDDKQLFWSDLFFCLRFLPLICIHYTNDILYNIIRILKSMQLDPHVIKGRCAKQMARSSKRTAQRTDSGLCDFTEELFGVETPRPTSDLLQMFDHYR